MSKGSKSKNPSQGENIPNSVGGLRIGELLIKEGFLKQKDINIALSEQSQELELSKYPLSHILVKRGALTKSDLNRLLDHPELKRNIGLLAVEKGFIRKDQLEYCLRAKGPDQLTGEFLMNEGLLTSDDIKMLLMEQINAPKLGELALQERLITEEELKKALKIKKSPRMLGEILCELGLINPLDLHYVLNKYKKQSKLGNILIKLGYIDQEALNNALLDKKHSSDSLGDILLSKKLITSEQLMKALSKQSNLPFKSFEGFSYADEEKNSLSAIVSQKYAEKNLVIPTSLKDKIMTLALFKPEKIETVRELSLYSHIDTSYVLITAAKFGELFEKLYGKKLSGLQSDEEEKSEATESKGADFMQITLDENMKGGDTDIPAYDVQDIEAEEMVNLLIKYGISNGASDIHLEQDREGIKLRYRIDGVLRDFNIGTLKKKIQEKAGAVISRIKIISNLDIAEKRLPQDGVFRINYYDKTRQEKTDLDFRVATCRAIGGENVVIRILDSRKANVGLEKLNHSNHVLEPFQRLLKGTAGMVLVTGPTGSGKSSTLYGALRYIYTPDIKIITAEDPIEYSFPGIMQTQVSPKIDLTFARLLRSFLRLDPDVILVGEIRDNETVKIGFDAAQTGHLVLSTLHTNDSVSAVSRLLDLDVDRAQIASSLSCVLAQRLVRRICTSCITEYKPKEEEWLLLFNEYPSHLTFYRGKGCEDCDFTGFKGRTLLSEVFVVDMENSRALNKGADVDELKSLALERGMKNMLDDGLQKLRDTTLSELVKVIPHDMIQEFRSRDQSQNVKASTIEDRAKDQIYPVNLSTVNSGFLVSGLENEGPLIDGVHERS
jgi:type IV pilus assembly protein PilB